MNNRIFDTNYILNKVFQSNNQSLLVRTYDSNNLFNFVFDDTKDALKVNIVNLQETFNKLYNRYVFRETFIGNGVDKTFQLTGDIGNGTWEEGTWDPANIILANRCDITSDLFKPIYDSTNILVRNRITVTSADNAGLITTDYAPRVGQAIYIWYWYSVKDDDQILDYQREEYVAEMEVGMDHTHTLAQITDYDDTNYLHPYSVDMSIEYDMTNGTISLVNDEDDPGINKVYGTSPLGVKGWIDLPEGETDHEALDNLMGGDALGHYHSDQAINKTDDVVFNKIKATSKGKNTEYITTVNEITGEFKTEIPTDQVWITNTTIIAALLLETNWSTGVYVGTIIGAVEGQMYLCCKYLYVYQNSTFNRIKLSRDNTTTVITTYTQLPTDDFIICNSATPFTLTLLPSANFTDFELKIKNIGVGVITIEGNLTETIDGELTQSLYQWDCINLYTNGTNWVIK